MKYVNIPTISTIYQTSCGWTTKGSLSLQGTTRTRVLESLRLLLFPLQSADGTLSVIDVRAKKSEPLARSEDQEDELLSIASIKKLASSLSI